MWAVQPSQDLHNSVRGAVLQDFVRRLMSLDVKHRPTATHALQHRWLNGAAPQARQLEAAPNRLKQFTNKRLLKVIKVACDRMAIQHTVTIVYVA